MRSLLSAVAVSVFLGGSLAAQEAVVQGPVGQQVDSLLRAAEAEGFHGNVLVSQGGTVVLLKGYGLANEQAGTRYSPSTLVQIGSNVKDFTKVAIYQLVEAGRLNLTDSLGRFVDGLAADKRGITIRQLLDHTAGLPLGVAMDNEPLERAEMLRRLNGLRLATVPGAAERYSNLGYALLAYIVERLSGQSFDAYLAERVLRPAGLRETGSYLPRFDAARIAHGYSGPRDIGIILDMPHDADGHLWALRGNGGYLSTVSDMHRFYAALSDATLLRDPAHRRAVFNEEGQNVLAGSDLTSQFVFANFPGRRSRVIIASNHSRYMANRLLDRIDEALGPVPGGMGRPQVVTTGGPGNRPAQSGPLNERLPDTGPGRTIAAWFAAYSSGDTAVMRQFYVELGAPGTAPIATRLERYLQMRENLGTLTFRGWRPSSDGEGIAVSVTTGRGESATLTFLVQPEAPNRLLGIRVEVG